MTREETKRIVRIIHGTYPSWKPDNLNELVDVWSKIFEHDDLSLVEADLMDYIKNDTSGFAPTPGQIRERQRMAELKALAIERDEERERIAEKNRFLIGD